MECRIELRNVFFSYKGKRVFENLNYVFEKGNIYLIEGCNGCGKTTLFKLITSIVFPLSGVIEVKGCKKNENLCSVLWQELPYVDYYVSDMVDIFARRSGNIDEFDKSFCVYSKLFGIEGFINREFLSLSGGEKQKIMLSLVFSYPSMFLLLDEPLNHLDKEGIDSLKKAITMEKEKDRGVLIITHHSIYFSDLTHDRLVLKRR